MRKKSDKIITIQSKRVLEHNLFINLNGFFVIVFKYLCTIFKLIVTVTLKRINKKYNNKSNQMQDSITFPDIVGFLTNDQNMFQYLFFWEKLYLKNELMINIILLIRLGKYK